MRVIHRANRWHSSGNMTAIPLTRGISRLLSIIRVHKKTREDGYIRDTSRVKRCYGLLLVMFGPVRFIRKYKTHIRVSSSYQKCMLVGSRKQSGLLVVKSFQSLHLLLSLLLQPRGSHTTWLGLSTRGRAEKTPHPTHGCVLVRYVGFNCGKLRPEHIFRPGARTSTCETADQQYCRHYSQQAFRFERIPTVYFLSNSDVFLK